MIISYHIVIIIGRLVFIEYPEVCIRFIKLLQNGSACALADFLRCRFQIVEHIRTKIQGCISCFFANDEHSFKGLTVLAQSILYYLIQCLFAVKQLKNIRHTVPELSHINIRKSAVIRILQGGRFSRRLQIPVKQIHDCQRPVAVVPVVIIHYGLICI